MDLPWAKYVIPPPYPRAGATVGKETRPGGRRWPTGLFTHTTPRRAPQQQGVGLDRSSETARRRRQWWRMDGGHGNGRRGIDGCVHGPVCAPCRSSEDRLDILAAEAQLHADHFGLEKVTSVCPRSPFPPPLLCPHVVCPAARPRLLACMTVLHWALLSCAGRCCLALVAVRVRLTAAWLRPSASWTVVLLCSCWRCVAG